MYLNIDIDSINRPFLNTLINCGECNREALYPFVDRFADTRITDLLFTIFCQYSATDSNVWMSYADKYLQTHENGIPVDHRNYHQSYYVMNRVFGIDPFSVWIDRAWERGIRPWISIRMNDCHAPEAETHYLRDDFFYEAREKGMMNGKRYGYYRNTLNYRFAEVRDRFLRYIGEQLERYHVYGVELDFMREIHCFDYAGADKDRCVSIMNDFMRSVKQTVTAAEKKKGRRIRIAVRLTCEVDKSLAFGFDARTWAKEGLVDLLIPSPRFHGSQSAIPVEEWKERCPETQILPCVESLLSSASAHAKNGVALMPLEVFRGHAASFLARGADGIYCYNLFGQMDPTRDALIHRTPDTAEELARLPRRYVTVGEDPDVCPQGFRPYQPLPLSPAKEPSALIFHTGEIPADQAVTLKIGLTEGEIESLTVAVNGIPVNAFSPVPMPTPKNAAPVNTRCYAARIQPSGKAQTVTFQRNGSASATVTWCELDVQPQ